VAEDQIIVQQLLMAVEAMDNQVFLQFQKHHFNPMDYIQQAVVVEEEEVHLDLLVQVVLE